MASVSCSQALDLLRSAAAGASVPASAAWEELSGRGAVTGSPSGPSITPMGRHVLGELELRYYRCADWPIDTLSEELTRVGNEIESIARSAKYFLSDLGPITPAEALPYLRMVSVGLANRRESPEEVAERFRNVWGMLEVIAGDPRDRLLAAELLTAAQTPMDSVYAPTVALADQLKAAGARRAVACSTILLLGPEAPSTSEALAAWQSARGEVPTDEAAALLVRVRSSPSAAAAFEPFRERFAALPGQLSGRVSAALYLACAGADPSTVVGRVADLAGLLKGAVRRPLLAAALLAAEHPLSPPEIVDWVRKASQAAERCQLASKAEEFEALGIALVEGLPRSTFTAKEAPRAAEASPLASAATLLGLHAWIYRPILDPGFEAEVGAVRRAPG